MMRMRKNTLLLMSKLPEPGRVKTRLTTQAGGKLSPEAACALCNCRVFDVAEIAMTALDELDAAQEERGKMLGSDSNETVRDTYEFVIATSPAESVPRMRRLFDVARTWNRCFEVIWDDGENYWESYDDAFEKCFDREADCILSVRGDLPSLTKEDVKLGFQKLHHLDGLAHGGIALAPDQGMSVSTVGLTRSADFSLQAAIVNQGIPWALPACIQEAAKRGLPVMWLPPIADVDTMDDLYHAAGLVQMLNCCAEYDDICPPWRTAAALYRMGFRDIVVRPGK